MRGHFDKFDFCCDCLQGEIVWPWKNGDNLFIVKGLDRLMMSTLSVSGKSIFLLHKFQ